MSFLSQKQLNILQRLIIPVGTTDDRPSAPVEGETRVNQSLNVVEALINGSFRQLDGLPIGDEQIASGRVAPGYLYPVNTESGPISLTIEEGGDTGVKIGFYDPSSTWKANNFTLKVEGSDSINGNTRDIVFSQNDTAIDYIKSSGSRGYHTLSGTATNTLIEGLNDIQYVSAGQSATLVGEIGKAYAFDSVSVVSFSGGVTKYNTDYNVKPGQFTLPTFMQPGGFSQSSESYVYYQGITATTQYFVHIDDGRWYCFDSSDSGVWYRQVGFIDYINPLLVTAWEQGNGNAESAIDTELTASSFLVVDREQVFSLPTSPQQDDTVYVCDLLGAGYGSPIQVKTSDGTALMNSGSSFVYKMERPAEWAFIQYDETRGWFISRGGVLFDAMTNMPQTLTTATENKSDWKEHSHKLNMATPDDVSALDNDGLISTILLKDSYNYRGIGDYNYPITSGDWNDLTRSMNVSVTPGLANAPVSTPWFYLQVYRHNDLSSTWCLQRATYLDQNNQPFSYVRVCVNGTWGTWLSDWNQSNLPIATETQAKEGTDNNSIITPKTLNDVQDMVQTFDALNGSSVQYIEVAQISIASSSDYGFSQIMVGNGGGSQTDHTGLYLINLGINSEHGNPYCQVTELTENAGVEPTFGYQSTSDDTTKTITLWMSLPAYTAFVRARAMSNKNCTITLSGMTATEPTWTVVDTFKLAYQNETNTFTKENLINITPSQIGTVVTDLTTAPFRYANITTATSVNTLLFTPFFHSTARSDGVGYTSHLNIGQYKRNEASWVNSGFYIALGGNDAHPTDYYRISQGGQIAFYDSGNNMTRRWIHTNDAATNAQTLTGTDTATWLSPANLNAWIQKDPVALGVNAGNTSQGAQSVAVGSGAGQTAQGTESVAIGYNAGNNTQSDYSIAIGVNAGGTTQGIQSVAIGLTAGSSSQGGSSVALGANAGNASQGANSVAVGAGAGTTTQGDFSIAVGQTAGQTTQGEYSTAIGANTGVTSQGSESTAIGASAGQNTQGSQSVAAGNGSGMYTQGTMSVAVGYLAGQNNQATSSVAVGYQAGLTSQGTETVAVGSSAGNDTQGEYSTAIGANTGVTTQGSESVAVGCASGQTTQGAGCVAVGNGSGMTSQGDSSVAVGYLAGETNQGTSSVSVGYHAGMTSQGAQCVAIGLTAGAISQSNYAIAVGSAAGSTSQGLNAVAVGYQAGQTTQGVEAVAIGSGAGGTSQGQNSVAIGLNSGLTSQSTDCVSIGASAGGTTQGTEAIAIGSGAGETTQGDHAIAIGFRAGETSQPTNSIAIGYEVNAGAAGEISLGSPTCSLKVDATGLYVNTQQIGAAADTVPTGLVAYFAMDMPPVGWMKANGAIVSRTTYATLFNIIGTTYGAGDGSTTFQIPDTRGEFIRGWDDGRGVDVGRAVGSYQAQDIQSHRHSFIRNNGWDDNGYTDVAGSDINSAVTTYTSYEGGTETRPRNLALLGCIKY